MRISFKQTIKYPQLKFSGSYLRGKILSTDDDSYAEHYLIVSALDTLLDDLTDLEDIICSSVVNRFNGKR